MVDLPVRVGRAETRPARRARIKAFGCLAAVLGATAFTVLTTLHSSARVKSPGRQIVNHPRCCWVVQTGQTLLSIASKEGVRLIDVERANPKLIAVSLSPGQRVRIPG